MLKKGQMREDFFYRINVIFLTLPVLRNRKEDIPLLVDDFLQSYQVGKKVTAIPNEIMTALCSYDWPVNIRELQNVLVRYLTIKRLDFMNSDRKAQTVESGSTAAINLNQENLNLQAAVENLEKTLIPMTLAQTNWNKSKAAMLLGIPRRTLFRKMTKLEMRPARCLTTERG